MVKVGNTKISDKGIYMYSINFLKRKIILLFVALFFLTNLFGCYLAPPPPKPAVVVVRPPPPPKPAVVVVRPRPHRSSVWVAPHRLRNGVWVKGHWR